jgi:hypothetical protein
MGETVPVWVPVLIIVLTVLAPIFLSKNKD